MPGRSLRVLSNQNVDDSDYDLLDEISLEFVTGDETKQLASRLFDGEIPGGGVGFIYNLLIEKKPVNWSEMAFDVMLSWAAYTCDKGSLLATALWEINENAASKLEESL